MINTKENPILDPDFDFYHFSHDQLYHFFKSLKKPLYISFLVGVYIEYNVDSYIFEKNPDFYRTFVNYIERKLASFIEFDKQNLLSEYQHLYLVLFDYDENRLVKEICELNNDLTKNLFFYHEKNHLIQLKCGIYFSHTLINPFQFYQCAYQQFHNIEESQDSFISVMNDT